MFHYLSTSPPNFQSGTINVYRQKKLLRKIAFKSYFGITYSETLMDQRFKDESCERQWPEAIDKASSGSKAVNKVIL